MTRIARGSGHHIPEVMALLEEHRRLAKLFQGGSSTVTKCASVKWSTGWLWQFPCCLRR